MPSGTPRRIDLWSLLDASWAAEEGGLDAFLHRVIERSAAHFGATGASLFLLDEISGDYRLASKSGLDARMPDDAVIRCGEGFAGEAIRTGRPLVIGAEPEARRELISAIVIPLSGPDGECVGVLNLSRGVGLRPFHSNDLRRARAVARHLALAVSNAMLFRRKDEAVREARVLHLRLRTVLDCLGVGMVVLDDQGRVVQRNAQFGIVTGSNLVEGASWSDRLGGTSAELAETLSETISAALEGRGERRHCSDPKTDRSWVVVGAPMPSGAAIAVEEVTDWDRLQRENARTRRLAEIGQMTAAIAHEIRNPLTGIRTAAQLVRSAPEQCDELGKIIEEEAVKLNRLCDEFLEFARPLRLELGSVNLREVAHAIADSCRGQFEDAGVSLSVHATDAVVEADRRRVEQVCRNLVLNALQACRPGGEVQIRVENGHLAVVDDGAGIDENAMDKLFTPFFTTKSQGTGLGLSTVRKIVDAHGGRIAVRSSPGRGTTFELQFGKAA